MNIKNLIMWVIIVLLSVGLFNMFQDPSKNNSQNNSYQPSLKYAFREDDFAGIISFNTGTSEELNRKTNRKYINDANTDNNSYYGKFVKSSGNTKSDLTI